VRVFKRISLCFNFFWLVIGTTTTFLFAQNSHAYPQYIGYGYSSCLTCHYNPEGGGPLTDYGRAVSATTIAARPPWISKLTTDDDLAEHSGVFGKVDTLPDWLRLQGNYRGMWLVSNVEDNPQKMWINMQAEASVVLQFFDDHHLYFVGTAGYIPPPVELQPDQAQTISTFISREHYAAYRINFDDKNSMGIYAGFMDPVFGIRTPDHEDYLRSETFLNQNDQTHAVMIHFSGEKFEGAIQAMLGNLYQDSSVRPVGVTSMGEYEVAQNLRIGGSAWHTSSDYRTRNMGAIHARIGYPEGNAVLAEIGLIGDKPIGQPGTLQSFGWLQNVYRITRGLNLLSTMEYYTADAFDSAPRSFRFGPGLQYTPMQRLEFRTDVWDSRQTGNEFGSPDSFTVISQVQVWL
jgi:hypothetical protein